MDGQYEYFSPFWLAIPIVAVVAAVTFWVVRMIAKRHSDRKTRALIEESNRGGPVPDVPEDVEIPEVVRRKDRVRLRHRLR